MDEMMQPVEEVAPAAPQDAPEAPVVQDSPAPAPVEATPAPPEAPAMTFSASAEPVVTSNGADAVVVIDAPAPDADPMEVVKADLARMEGEITALVSHRVRLENEVSTLQQTLDAERASSVKPGWEALGQQVTDLKAQLAAEQAENAALKAAQGVPATLDEVLAHIKEVFLAALAEHTVANTVEAEPAAEAPASPFINRGAQ